MWVPWDPTVRIITREQVLGLSQKRRFLLDTFRSELQIKTAHGTLKFGLDPRLLLSRNTEDWARAIREWAQL